MTMSVVIPTYQRLPILTKCLRALEAQHLEAAYEVLVVDDGSTDGTVDFLTRHAASFPHVRLLVQERNGGAAAARNMGVAAARGEVVVFIDSDIVVTSPSFLSAHAAALRRAFDADGDQRAFTYGRVVNTSRFDEPTLERFKLTDMSAAFFATGNVAIARARLLEVAEAEGADSGPFDVSLFNEYGWEDLELGERLRTTGARIVQCPEAVGFHYHPEFTMEQLPALIAREQQRGRGAVHFLNKHRNWRVRLMVQMTPLHWLLWAMLTLGGQLERALLPVLSWLVDTGHPSVALGLLSPLLNWYSVEAARQEARKTMSPAATWLM